MVFRYPRRAVDQLRDQMNRLFNEFGGDGGYGWPMAGRGQPAVNAWEKDNAVMVEVEIPGVTSDEIEISVVENELILKIERPEAQQPGVIYHRRERPAGSFTRVVRLPVAVDSNRVSAELRNGVLTITLPKAESARPRKINVVAR